MPALMHNISIIYRCASEYRQQALAPLGLKSCHASYLIAVTNSPGITQDQLSKRIYFNKSSIARQLAFLEEAGFVSRVPSPDDKRAIQVFPTQKALDAIPVIRQCFRDWEAMTVEDLSEDEYTLLIGILTKMRMKAAAWMEGQ